MKTKFALLQAGAFAGALLLSAQAQSGGAGAGAGAGAGTGSAGAAGTTGVSAPTSGSVTPGTSSANTGAVPGAPIISPSTNSANTGIPLSSSSSVGTSVQPSSSTRSSTSTLPMGSGGLPAGTDTGLPAVSPGTNPIGPMPSPIPEAGVGSQTTVTAPSNANSVGAGTGGQVRMPRTPGVGAEPGLRARSTTTLPISAPITITVPTPPPQLPESTPVGTAPSANHIWVPGHPVWNGQWTTTEGQWALPPAPGATWVDGNYDTSTRAWRSGHWSTNPPPASR